MKAAKVKTGDIISTPTGPRLVVYVFDDSITVRPLAAGMDRSYMIDRDAEIIGPWTLLARGDWRCEPDAGRMYVR